MARSVSIDTDISADLKLDTTIIDLILTDKSNNNDPSKTT